MAKTTPALVARLRIMFTGGYVDVAPVTKAEVSDIEKRLNKICMDEAASPEGRWFEYDDSTNRARTRIRVEAISAIIRQEPPADGWPPQ